MEMRDGIVVLEVLFIPVLRVTAVLGWEPRMGEENSCSAALTSTRVSYSQKRQRQLLGRHGWE